MIVLGIETSCDETAAALVRDGNEILSSVVASQIEVHRRYGGVVPELASRKHLEAIVPVVEEALETAGLQPENLDALAATQGPGLVGALLVGYSFAKGYAYSLQIPWCGVDHLEAHLNSVFLGSTPPPFPFAALLASGGHTSVYIVKGHTEFEFMGGTRDDAAGEAFDKVSKMLGLGYPGGPVIGELSEQGDPDRIRFPRPFLDKTEYDFSFSGVKSAVHRYIQTHDSTFAEEIPHIVAGFQEAVVDVLVFKLIRAAEDRGCGHIAVVGGVAANRRLRDRAKEEAGRKGLSVHMPPAALCGDNAAMVSAAGYHFLQSGVRSDLDSDVYSRRKQS